MRLWIPTGVILGLTVILVTVICLTVDSGKTESIDTTVEEADTLTTSPTSSPRMTAPATTQATATTTTIAVDWESLPPGCVAERVLADGSRIALSVNERLFIISAEGVRAVDSPSGATQKYPRWSPDGSKLAYISEGAGGKRIAIADRDGLHLKSLAPENRLSFAISWSPDSETLVYSAHDGQEWTLHTTNLDGTEGRVLTSGSDCRLPSWSPDGKTIAFASNSAAPNGKRYDLWILDLDQVSPTQLTHDQKVDSTPAWSPDGSRIAFARGFNVCVVEKDSGVTTLPYEGGSPVGSLAWSPDSSKVSFIRNGSLCVVPSLGGAAACPTSDPRVFSCKSPQWSTDGSVLMFLANLDDFWHSSIVCIDLKDKDMDHLGDVGLEDLEKVAHFDGVPGFRGMDAIALSVPPGQTTRTPTTSDPYDLASNPLTNEESAYVDACSSVVSHISERLPGYLAALTEPEDGRWWSDASKRVIRGAHQPMCETAERWMAGWGAQDPPSTRAGLLHEHMKELCKTFPWESDLLTSMFSPDSKGGLHGLAVTQAEKKLTDLDKLKAIGSRLRPDFGGR